MTTGSGRGAPGEAGPGIGGGPGTGSGPRAAGGPRTGGGPPALDEDHVARVIRDVVAGVLRERGLTTLVLASPPSPASRLLARWLDPISLLVPGSETVAAMARTLGVTLDAPAAWIAAGSGLAAIRSGLAVDTAHKGQLLLDGSALPCHPLGDLWGAQLAAWAGESVRVPRALTGVSPSEYIAVEAALREALDDGARLSHALAALPGELPARIREALLRAGGSLRPTLVPRVSSWTPGLDPGF